MTATASTSSTGTALLIGWIGRRRNCCCCPSGSNGSAHADFVPHANLEIVRGGAVPHRDFQQPAAADQRQWLPRRHFPVRLSDLPDFPPFDRHLSYLSLTDVVVND